MYLTWMVPSFSENTHTSVRFFSVATTHQLEQLLCMRLLESSSLQA